MILLEAIAGGVLGGAFGTGLVLILSALAVHIRRHRINVKANREVDREIKATVEQWKRELS